MAIFSIHKNLEKGAQDGLTYWQWRDKQEGHKEWEVWLDRYRQLSFEAHQEKFEAMRQRKSSKKYIALNRYGWPEGGTNCKVFHLFDTEIEAGKDGLRAFGRKEFQVCLFSRFLKTKEAIFVNRRIAIRQKLDTFKKSKPKAK